MNIGGVDTPFEQCDADTATVTTTGGTLAGVFTNLSYAKCREVVLQNRGNVNLLVGPTTGAAKWRVLPGSVFNCAPKELADVFIKAESGAGIAVDIFIAV